MPSKRRRQRASVSKISAKCYSFSAVPAPIFARKYAFCSIFQNLPDSQAENFEIWQNFANFATFAIFFAEISRKLLFFQTDFLRKFWDCSGAKVCKSCRAWKMLSNAYFLAKFRFDTAENEPAKNLQNLQFLNLFFWGHLVPGPYFSMIFHVFMRNSQFSNKKMLCVRKIGFLIGK